MFNLKDRVIPIKIIEIVTNSSVEIEALIDTGASTSCIPKKTVKKLNLNPVGIIQVHTTTGQSAIEQYVVGIQIKGKIYNTPVIAIDNLDFALIGYDGIIVKEISDIEIQSVEEKVNMLASLSRFIICDNSFTSGHIDELKICASNRFTTAIIQEVNKGATWMQSDYSVDYNFMQTFTYSDISKIPDAVKQSVTWAEEQLKKRTAILNSIYHWRKR